jgi:hypothetical protein
MGLHERSSVRRKASLGFAANTKHSEAVRKVEFSCNSVIWLGQQVKIWSRNIILIGNSLKINLRLSPTALSKVIASLS